MNDATHEMIVAGAEVILGEIGGADIAGFFSAADLAEKVYLAMEVQRTRAPIPPTEIP